MAEIEKQVIVLYEDDSLLVVNKPSGMVTTRELSVTKNSYLEDWVNEYRPNELPRRGIVHRLDKDTSGIVVVAKNLDALRELKDLFKKRKIVKKYLALVGGGTTRDGEINMPILRSKFSFGRFKVDVDGKSAITQFKTLKKIKIDGKIFSLVSINLKTGRTHQIRVHFNYLGWPLFGDKVYGGYQMTSFNRHFLHSEFLEFKHPFTKKLLTVHSPLAVELQNILDQFDE